MSQTPEYKAYRGARYRCTRPTAQAWANYGGRGIKFNFNSFEEFIAEVGSRPTPRHQIDRINNDGHYEKGNVRWVLPAVNAANKRMPKRNRINSVSGFKGVHPAKDCPGKPWKAQFRANGKPIYLGLFASPVDAAKAYDAAAKVAFGSRAITNF